ncbi:hypothetical protein BHC44_10850 [Snodgrassella alvi]|nr:hypothetical protein BHC44_10850 [Snodgrassella alvi]
MSESSPATIPKLLKLACLLLATTAISSCSGRFAYFCHRHSVILRLWSGTVPATPVCRAVFMLASLFPASDSRQAKANYSTLKLI